MKYFSLYSYYVQCEVFARTLTFVTDRMDRLAQLCLGGAELGDLVDSALRRFFKPFAAQLTQRDNSTRKAFPSGGPTGPNYASCCPATTSLGAGGSGGEGVVGIAVIILERENLYRCKPCILH